MNTSDFAPRLAYRLSELQQGTASWQKPWAEDHNLSASYNSTTDTGDTDFSEPRWITYKKAKAGAGEGSNRL